MPTSAYQYLPLEGRSHIRVLILHPAVNHSDQLKADLVHVDRKDILIGQSATKFYEAVSYCWGDATLTDAICINYVYRFDITSNVNIMLRYLRKFDEPRYLWVDAICINQKDVEEKDIQVRAMHEIFTQATKVRIWLGEAVEEDHVEAVFAALKAVVWTRRLEASDKSYAEGQQTVLRSICGEDFVSHLNRFFSRQWFKRRWILQEAALGFECIVHCGTLKLRWVWFVEGATGLLDGIGGEVLDQNALAALYTVQAISKSTSSDLLTLLWQFHTSQCSTPQDSIFAIHGLATDSASVPELSYSQHWVEIFTRVAGHYFRKRDSRIWDHLMYFGSLSTIEPPGVKYPSWVPNWTKARADTFFSKRLRNKFVVPGLISYFPQDPCIELSGYYMGDLHSVEKFSQKPTSDTVSPDTNTPKGIKRSYALASALASILVNEENSAASSVRKDLMKLGDPSKLERSFFWAILKSLPGKYVLTEPRKSDMRDIASRYLELIYEHFRLFGLRKHGVDAVGVGPRDVQNGDVVVTTGGSTLKQPRSEKDFFAETNGCILRPVESLSFGEESQLVKSQFRYIGPCVVVDPYHALPLAGGRKLVLNII